MRATWRPRRRWSINSEVMETACRSRATVRHDATAKTVGDHLREWRQRRHMSQLDLALDAEISTRHLSFVETGRSQPSREMLLHLAERLDVPLRERNCLLVAAGYAPVFPERRLERSGARRRAARRSISCSKGHEPYPASRSTGIGPCSPRTRRRAALMAGADASLLQPPVNVLRLSLHPAGPCAADRQLSPNGAPISSRGCASRSTSPPTRSSSSCCASSATIKSPAPGLGRASRRARPSSRRGRAAAARHRGRRPLLLQHHDGLRHPGRHHAVRDSRSKSFFPADAATADALQRMFTTVSRAHFASAGPV